MTIPLALAMSAGDGLRRASAADRSVAFAPQATTTSEPELAPASVAVPDEQLPSTAPAFNPDVRSPVVDPEPTTAAVSVGVVSAAPVATTANASIRLVSGVGDSIMVGATDELRAAIAAATGAPLAVDARVGRPFGEGVGVVARLVAAGEIGDVVVVHLGTNGPIDEAVVRALLDQLGTARRVLLVNVRAPVPWEASVNETLAAVGPTYPNVRLVDWHAAGDGHDELFVSDGIHLRPQGNRVYAELLTAAITAR